MEEKENAFIITIRIICKIIKYIFIIAVVGIYIIFKFFIELAEAY